MSSGLNESTNLIINGKVYIAGSTGPAPFPDRINFRNVTPIRQNFSKEIRSAIQEERIQAIISISNFRKSNFSDGKLSTKWGVAPRERGNENLVFAISTLGSDYRIRITRVANLCLRCNWCPFHHSRSAERQLQIIVGQPVKE